MAKHGKKYLKASELIESGKRYSLQEGFDLIPKVAFAKFDESVEAVFSLGVDTRNADQQVRGALVLPHGTGKSAKVAVVARGDKAKEAQEAGAAVVGAEDLVEKIAGGWLDFDKLICTPDMMVPLAKLGKVLGPRGLMPNPKLGTVTMDVARAVREQQAGKVEYRAEKAGLVHVLIGKKSFGAQKLRENFQFLADAIIKAKPATSKGTYLRGVTVSTTMSPGVSLDVAEVMKQA